ncbi:acylphosphatase [Niveomyces insectorum RCEF 264]|uniref:acylphosphatase n=1 Tax=Niveomyces insectorum RCEF 264 TaxID=1081102 RepID=A0A167PEI1_9HYPO|nr:acylphosphatase [Niveomyces insectorum RCEF 264]
MTPFQKDKREPEADDAKVYFLAHGGTVQGVGYRYFARKHAIQRELTGWVRNLPNNKVEGEVQGDEKTVEVFLQLLDRGPTSAKVVRFDKETRELVKDEAEFEVRR